MLIPKLYTGNSNPQRKTLKPAGAPTQYLAILIPNPHGNEKKMGLEIGGGGGHTSPGISQWFPCERDQGRLCQFQ